MNKTLAEVPGNEQWSEREGQPLGPPEIKAPLTQVGVSARNGNPIGRNRSRWPGRSRNAVLAEIGTTRNCYERC